MKKGNYIDITGEKFNHLTAISFVEIRPKTGSIWKFQCDCGNIVEFPAGRVKCGTTKSCGCINHGKSQKYDITGMRFGKWTAIEKVGGKWKCRCECGNESFVSSSDLRNGRSKNCGHCKMIIDGKEVQLGNVRNDLTGKHFGYWEVLHRVENKGGEVCYLCRCKCGKEKTVSSHSLVTNNSTSCGCKKISDFTGKRFGRLVVIERAEPRITESGKRIQMWKCKCDCGNEVLVRYGNLQKGCTGLNTDYTRARNMWKQTDRRLRWIPKQQ